MNETNTFIQQAHMKLIKSNSKNTKYPQINAVLLNSSNNSEKKCSINILISTAETFFENIK